MNPIPYTFNHDHTCDSCRGAAAHRSDHYAIGRLRSRIAADLGLSHDAQQQLSVPELLAGWQTFKRGITLAATRSLVLLEAQI